MAKNKVKKRDFSKAKEKALKILKISAKVTVAIIGIAALLAFVVVPFLHSKINDVVAKFVWYPSCVLFVVSAVATVFKKPKTPSKYLIFDFLGNLGLVPIAVIFSSAFLINYYDTAYTWWWAIFVLVALFLPFFVFGMRSFLKKEKEYTEDQIKTSLKVCWKYVGFYWLMDLFYMAIFNYWTADEQSQTLWLTLQFVFGGLAMVYIFYNLARAFLSNAQKHWWGLLQDFLWGIAITVYLIFLIPDDALQTIVLSITAAVYGGLLTLVGVAWTIKDTNEKRKEDLIRVETERKEEERKKNIPYIRLAFNKDLPPLVANTTIVNILNFENSEELARLERNVFYQISIKDFIIKNLSNTNIILNGVIAYGKYFEFSRMEIVEPDACCLIKTTKNTMISVAYPEQSIHLVISDTLGHQYKTECHLTLESGTDRWRIVTTIDGEEYTGFEFPYMVSSIELPNLLK